MKSLLKHSLEPTSAAPISVFRILFGMLTAIGLLRFYFKGWIHDVYVIPKYHFHYLGFEWVQNPGETGIYLLFLLAFLSALGILFGLFYRMSALAFFLSFTYIELIDKTTYLNHYYFISLMAFLLIFLPAHRYFSFDAYRNPSLRSEFVPQWTLWIIKFQILCVYFFAGLAKVQSDWLLEALPLKIWLPAKSNLPIIGSLLQETWAAYLFSWLGCLFDLVVPFFLLFKKTRIPAYIIVVGFHLVTALLLPVIGLFPWMMIVLTLVFFSDEFHLKIISKLKNWKTLKGKSNTNNSSEPSKHITYSQNKKPAFVFGISIYIFIQLVLPFRYLAYPGDLFWTEEGYRFSWRVMLTEKAGVAFFTANEKGQKQTVEIQNANFLTPFQEKMMATQPDFMVEYAHILRDHFISEGWQNPEIRMEAYVTLNGSGSSAFNEFGIDLSKEENSLKHKDWILERPNATSYE